MPQASMPGWVGQQMPQYTQQGQGMPGFTQPGMPQYTQPGMPQYSQPGMPQYTQPGVPGMPQYGGMPQQGIMQVNTTP